MTYLVTIFFLLFLSSNNLFSQGTVKQSLWLESKFLHQPVKYSVYLPEGYSPEQHYPVIYLFHGFGGDETSWLNQCRLKETADSLISCKVLPPFIAIMPYGFKSYYIDNYNNELSYETFFTQEFLPFTDSLYSLSNQSSERALGGLSMGGYGAVVLTLKHPGLFGTCISLSGALRTPEQFMALSPVRYHEYFSQVFGPSLQGNDRLTAHWKSNSPYYLIDSLKASSLRSILWYIDCGNQDDLLPSSKAFYNLLQEYQFPASYSVGQGDHNYPYWTRRLAYALEFWGATMQKEP